MIKDYQLMYFMKMLKCVDSSTAGKKPTNACIYDLASKPDNLDRRQLPTRAHEGKRLSIPKIRNMKFYRSIYYRAADSWNKLIPSMTLIDSRPEFKRILDGLIVNPYTEDN